MLDSIDARVTYMRREVVNGAVAITLGLAHPSLPVDARAYLFASHRRVSLPGETAVYLISNPVARNGRWSVVGATVPVDPSGRVLGQEVQKPSFPERSYITAA